MNPCAYCGEDKDSHGTKVDAELFIEDRTYAIEPSFCSWQHAAAWFAQPPPDITAWHSTVRRPARVEGGPGTWIILLVLVVLLLAVAIALGTTLS